MRLAVKLPLRRIYSRFMSNVFCWYSNVLGMGAIARDFRSGVDCIASGVTTYLSPYFYHTTRKIPAQSMGEFDWNQVFEISIPYPSVQWVNGGCNHFYQNFIGSNAGDVYFLNLEDVSRAMLVNTCCFHVYTSVFSYTFDCGR